MFSGIWCTFAANGSRDWREDVDSRLEHSPTRVARTPPLAKCGREKIVCGALNKVAHHLAYEIEILPTPRVVCCLAQCPHKDFRRPYCAGGGGRDHPCILVQERRRQSASLEIDVLEKGAGRRQARDVPKVMSKAENTV